MPCDEVMRALEADGEPNDATRRRLTEHARSCAACRAMLDLVAGDGDAPEIDPPRGLVNAVLRKTTGPACGRCRDRLCDYVDETSAPLDRDLVAGHLATCPECAELSHVLARLRRELPTLAEQHPGPGFVDDVLDATFVWPRRARRLADRLRRLAARPRIAWEGAYVGAMLLLLIFGSPNTPLAGVPGRALAAASANPVERVREPIETWERRAVSGLASAWDATRDVAVDVFGETGQRVRLAAESGAAPVRHLRALAMAVARADGSTLAGEWRTWIEDLGTLRHLDASDLENDNGNGQGDEGESE